MKDVFVIDACALIAFLSDEEGNPSLVKYKI